MRKTTTTWIVGIAVVLAVAASEANAPVWAQGDSSADSPLAGDSTLVELLLSEDGTRAEMAKRLLQALEVAAFQPEDCVAGEEMFSDVPASSPFCSWVEELVRRGLTAGCGDDRYCPSDPVNRQQMAVFLVRAIEAATETYERFVVMGVPGGNIPFTFNVECDSGDVVIGGWAGHFGVIVILDEDRFAEDGEGTTPGTQGWTATARNPAPSPNVLPLVLGAVCTTTPFS